MQMRLDRMVSIKLSYALFSLLLWVPTSVSYAANILVNARPGSFGCDLIEAIESANTNSAVGGCAAGSTGLDTIRFFAGFTRYELPDLIFANGAGGSGTPEITSEIRIVGQGDEPLIIARPSDETTIYRAFTVSLADGDLTLENLSLQNFGQTSGLTGGAIRVAGRLTINNVEITDNSAAFGGAIWVQGGRATIRNSLIRNNRASDQGGGIGVSSNSNVSVFDSTISNNHSDYGGGIALSAAPDSVLALFNTTISENSAEIRGGGLSLLMSNADAANSAIIRNSIISGNSAPTSREVHFVNSNGATELDVRHNVLGTDAHTYRQSVNTQNFLTTGNLAMTSDFLNTPLRQIIEPLANNGGKTMTHALAPSSPAIDNGLQYYVTGGPSLFFFNPGCRGESILLGPGEYRPDQRGVARPAGNECDIGAYEFEPVEEVCYVIKARNNNLVTFCF